MYYTQSSASASCPDQMRRLGVGHGNRTSQSTGLDNFEGPGKSTDNECFRRHRGTPADAPYLFRSNICCSQYQTNIMLLKNDTHKRPIKWIHYISAKLVYRAALNAKVVQERQNLTQEIFGRSIEANAFYLRHEYALGDRYWLWADKISIKIFKFLKIFFIFL